MPDDPWAQLGLPRTYVIDPAAVRRAYLARAGSIHPDHSPLDEESAAAQSAALNRAKAILDDPERRAGELLRLLGGPSKEDDRSLPPAFLMEMMEVRERLETERTDADRERWEAWGRERRAAHQSEVARLFQRLDTTPPNPSTDPPNPARASILKSIRTELNAWRYIERLLEQF